MHVVVIKWEYQNVESDIILLVTRVTGDSFGEKKKLTVFEGSMSLGIGGGKGGFDCKQRVNACLRISFQHGDSGLRDVEKRIKVRKKKV